MFALIYLPRRSALSTMLLLAAVSTIRWDQICLAPAAFHLAQSHDQKTDAAGHRRASQLLRALTSPCGLAHQATTDGRGWTRDGMSMFPGQLRCTKPRGFAPHLRAGYRRLHGGISTG